jgi:hypothetical protein
MVGISERVGRAIGGEGAVQVIERPFYRDHRYIPHAPTETASGLPATGLFNERKGY